VPISHPSIRYLSFYEALGDAAESGAEWRAVSAGLLVLRLVDAWLDGDAHVTSSAPAVLAAAQAVDPSDGGRASLLALAELIAGHPVARTIQAVAPGLLAYVASLESAGRHRLMADAAACLASHARSAADADVAIQATIEMARGEQLAARPELAAASFQRAARIARESGDLHGALRARLGLVEVGAARDDAPGAGREVDAVMRRARAAGLEDVVGLCTELSGAIALADAATVGRSGLAPGGLATRVLTPGDRPGVARALLTIEHAPLAAAV
jgi:hypothetical protein